MAFAVRPTFQKYLVLGLLTFVLLALSIEFSLYLLIEFGVLSVEKPTYSIDNALSRFWVETNEHFGVWHAPHARYRNLKACFDVTYTANAHGARDVERSVEHQGSRVVVLGDSFVEGYGVALAERFSNILERDTHLEHLNFGTSGHFGPIQYYMLYKTLAKQFAHSAVLVGIFPGNDFLDNDYEYSKKLHANRYRPYFVGTYPHYRLIYDQEHINKSVNTLKNIIREFTFSYATYNRIKTILLHRKHHIQSGYYHFTDAQFHIMQYSIEKIVQEAQGKAVYLFTIPQFSDFQDYRDHGEAPLAQKLRALSQELAIGYVDLLPYMYHRTQDWAQYYMSCDGHWNAHGHYVASEYLRQQIPLYHAVSR